MMNRWGWIKCWRQRNRIVQWLIEAADKNGVYLTGDTAGALLAEGFKLFFFNKQESKTEGEKIVMPEQQRPEQAKQQLELEVTQTIVATVVLKANEGMTVLEANKQMVDMLTPMKDWEVTSLQIGKRAMPVEKK